MNSPDLLTVDDVAELLKVSRSTVYEYLKRDHLPQPVKIGPRLARWLRQEVEEWIAEQAAARTA